MKKIIIECLASPDKQNIRISQRSWCLFLHWDLTVSYTNRKKAEAFQAGLNVFLNEKLFQLNEAYISAAGHYRRAWFYFDNSPGLETSADRSLESCAEVIGRAINFQSGSDGANRVFIFLQKGISSLITCYEIINKINAKRNAWAEIKILNAEISRLKYLNDELMAYPGKVIIPLPKIPDGYKINQADIHKQKPFIR